MVAVEKKNKNKRKKTTSKRTSRRPIRADAVLKRIWEDLESPASYSTPHKLWKEAVKSKPNLQLAQVEQWLSTQPSYTLHRKVVSKFVRRKVLSKCINYQWQADLMDMKGMVSTLNHGALKRENEGKRYVLAVIDCFSRYAYARAMKTKTCASTTLAFKSILKESKQAPCRLQTDKGREFLGLSFQRMLNNGNIYHFVTEQDLKAQIVERFNRTFKEKLTKYFRATGSKNYVNVLRTIVKTYNNTPHSGIAYFAPSKVTLKNQKKIHRLQFAKYLAEKPSPHKFKEDDTVRLCVFRKTFKRTFDKNFTAEIFLISKLLHTNPPMYIIKDQKGEQLKGAFYEPELVRTR